MRMLVAGLALVLVGSVPVQAQCPKADSLLGPKTDYEVPKMEYDDMSDTTKIRGKQLMESPMNGDMATSEIWTYFAGKTPKDTGVTMMEIVIEQHPHGGKKLTAEDRNYASVTEALFKFDDSVRFRAPVVKNEYKIDSQIFIGQRLRETMWVKLSAADRARIARSHEGTVRVKDYNLGFASRNTASLSDVVRFMTCSGT